MFSQLENVTKARILLAVPKHSPFYYFPLIYNQDVIASGSRFIAILFFIIFFIAILVGIVFRNHQKTTPHHMAKVSAFAASTHITSRMRQHLTRGPILHLCQIFLCQILNGFFFFLNGCDLNSHSLAYTVPGVARSVTYNDVL